jgi:uncharacterized protein (TIGR03000 family)
MYSMVMMMALTGTADAAECGRHRCNGCYGCYGGYACYGCNGCTGCYGCNGCGGCFGFRGCHGCNGGLFHGCHGCNGCYGGCAGCFGGYMMPYTVPPGTPPMKSVDPKGTDIPVPPNPGAIRAPATIQINVPAEAVVYFDGFRTTVNGNRRFATPALEQGKTYFYTVKIEMQHDGQTVATTERIIVRAGGQAQVSVDVSPTGTVSARLD